MKKKSPMPARADAGLWLPPLLLLGVLSLLFWRSFLPDYVHFSNDGPLGQQNWNWVKQPDGMFGMWDDANDVGFIGGASAPGINTLLTWFLGPLGFAKFLAPVALLMLGLGAWTFFRALKLAPLAAILGTLATALSSAFLSSACWGVAAGEMALGLDFVALALVLSNTAETPRLVRWTRLALAGLCVGINVIDASDVGALFSLVIALFVFYRSLVDSEGGLIRKISRGVGHVAVIAAFAGFIATQTIVALVGIEIQGVAGTAQDTGTKTQHWDWATQWSLPKAETLGFFVPGLFGYKMDTPKDMMPNLFFSPVAKYYEGGVYWGGVGRSPEIDRFIDKTFQAGDEVIVRLNTSDHPNQAVGLSVQPDGSINAPLLGPVKVAGLSGLKLAETVDQSYAAKEIQGSVEPPAGLMRFSGGGNYCGLLVCLLAAWTIAQSLRKKDSPFSEAQKKMIWFWGVVLVVSLLLAWGRFAPLFYGLLYKLPYFSTIRNPCKFVTFVAWALVILFAYGVHALSQRYLTSTAAKSAPLIAQLKNWWARAGAFDRKWMFASATLLGGSLLGWLVFAGEKPGFVSYLKIMGYPDDALAGQIATFSIAQAGWFTGLLAVALLLLTLIMAGYFSGPRAKIGGVLLGAFLVFDLGRADLPYIIHWDYKQKYDIDAASPNDSINPIINFLRDKPYEHRVAILPFETQQSLRAYDNTFGGNGIYRIEWTQHHFPYYNIQCLDWIQMARLPEDLKTYLEALSPRGTQESAPLFARRWQLSNTKYLLGPAGFLEGVNQQLDPAQRRFRIVQRFDIVAKPGILQPQRLEELTAATSPDGDLALFEFTGALSRAKLYSNWLVNTNDADNLKTLADLSFDPAKTVLISTPQKNLPAVATNENSGTVEFKSYSPKKIVFDANATTPSVLLLNDKYDPNWHVTVDGQPADLLRCNFLMRGVQVPPGRHTVEFHFSVPSRPLYVTLAAFATGIFLTGLLFFLTRKPQASSPAK